MAICSNPSCNHQWSGQELRCHLCRSLAVDALIKRRYKVKQVVGKGGFGITYLAHDCDCLEDPRILKQLNINPNGSKNHNRDVAERLFQREAQVLLRLRHPGIPDLHGYFIEDDYSYLVQDYIPGHTLMAEVAERNYLFDEAEARKVLADLADILHYLHSHQPPIIHRDIKPENLMHHVNGRLLLIDFGAVCQILDEGSSQTFIYSPGYTPPEQIAGQPMPQSDLYAAGATILRLLLGPKAPLKNIPRPGQWESLVDISAGFADIINSLLIPDVFKRLGSAQELKYRLHQLPALAPKTSPILIRDENWLSSAPTDFYQERINSRLSEQTAIEIGSLTRTPLLNLFQRIYQEKLTGSVTYTEKATKTIHFDNGAIVAASSSVLSENLNEMLLSRTNLSTSNLQQIRQQMQTLDISFGAALVRNNLLHFEKLKEISAQQIEQILSSLFEWVDGQYELRINPSVFQQGNVSLPIPELILTGLRQTNNLAMLKMWIGDTQRPLKVKHDVHNIHKLVRLTPREAFTLSRIQTNMSVEEVLSLACLPEVEMLKTISGLLAIGALQWLEPSRCATIIPMPLQAVRPSAAEESVQLLKEVQELLVNASESTYYKLLNINSNANLEEVSRAYQQMVRKFHPQMHVTLIKQQPALKTALEKLSMHIITAYRVLTDKATRNSYDQEITNLTNNSINQSSRAS